MHSQEDGMKPAATTLFERYMIDAVGPSSAYEVLFVYDAEVKTGSSIFKVL